MISTPVEQLLLALIVVVPGFVATQIAISLGVVRKDLSKFHVLITSLVVSLLVITVFLQIAQPFTSSSISQPQDIGEIFFVPVFRPGFILGLIGLSVLTGVLGGVALAWDVHKWCRSAIWSQAAGDRRRNFYEPWEGTLQNAARVQIHTSDGAVAIGALHWWSDDRKERQIALTSVEWHSPSTDGWVDPDTDIELFFEDDIRQVAVVDVKSDLKDTNEEGDKDTGE